MYPNDDVPSRLRHQCAATKAERQHTELDNFCPFLLFLQGIQGKKINSAFNTTLYHTNDVGLLQNPYSQAKKYLKRDKS